MTHGLAHHDGQRARPLATLHSTRVWLPTTMTWLHGQVRHLPADIASTVVCDRLDEPGRWPGIKARALPRRDLRRPWQGPSAAVRAKVLARRIRSSKARVVHSHFGNVGWEDMPAIAAAREGSGRPIHHVVSFYGQDLTRFPRLNPEWSHRYRALLDGGALVLCEGPHMASVARAFSASGARVLVHHLGVDLETIKFRGDPDHADRLSHPASPGTPRRPLRILIASSFREKKGVPDAIAAIAAVAREGVSVEATLIGQGDAASGDEPARVEAALLASGLGQRVRRLGYQTHERLLEEAYSHDVYLAPSRTAHDGDTEGGAPIGLLEMAATGMPVVSTRHCDIPHVLPASYSPLLSAEGDVPGLARSLHWLADHVDAWSGLTLDARRHLEASFDARKQGVALAALYHKEAGV